jgi:hypothetical protein
MAPKLSHQRWGWGGGGGVWKNSLSSILNQESSIAVIAIARYSIFVLDLDITGYFLACQETKLALKKTK